jgi:hypothetical protein
MNTPTQGALNAARLIMTADDPARFANDYAAEDEQRAIAEIIDRETAAPDLLTAIEHVLIASEDNGDMNDIDWQMLRSALAKAKGAAS